MGWEPTDEELESIRLLTLRGGDELPAFVTGSLTGGTWMKANVMRAVIRAVWAASPGPALEARSVPLEAALRVMVVSDEPFYADMAKLAFESAHEAEDAIKALRGGRDE